MERDFKGTLAFVTAFLGYAYGASSDRARAMAELEELKKESHGKALPFNLALVYLGMGDRQHALDCSQPRYVALMKQLRFNNFRSR